MESVSFIVNEEALEIARRDAKTAYGDLSMFRTTISQRDGAWLVDFELKDEKLHGGGPHYVIDARNGNIVSKRYEQ
jgi:hypothetical protein